MRVLVTGATGYIGSELVRALLFERAVKQVFIVVRSQGDLGPEDRKARLISQWQRFARAPNASELARLVVVAGDLEAAALAGPENDQLDVLIHTAALTDLSAPLATLRRCNLAATQRALDFARRSGARRFIHFSTAYVAGTRRGLIRPLDGAPRAFHNHYERTKHEAEACVRGSGVPYVIVRPSIVIGRSDDGYTPKMKVLYSVWRAWLTGAVPRAPIDGRAWVDLVPVDYVVEATLALLSHPGAESQTLHLCAGEGRVSPRTVMAAAARAFGVAMPPTAPPWAARALMLPFVNDLVAPSLAEILRTLYWHLPYLGVRDRLFDTRTTERLLAGSGIFVPNFSEYGERLFGYCHRTAWGKRAPLSTTDQPHGERLGDTMCLASS